MKKRKGKILFSFFSSFQLTKFIQIIKFINKMVLSYFYVTIDTMLNMCIRNILIFRNQRELTVTNEQLPPGLIKPEPY